MAELLPSKQRMRVRSPPPALRQNLYVKLLVLLAVAVASLVFAGERMHKFRYRPGPYKNLKG